MQRQAPYVSNIQRFSLDDGPGIRTTVFFKGCNLHCAWCHNPECITPGRSLQFEERACVGCGVCVGVCPNGVHTVDAQGLHRIDRSRCTFCGICADRCPHAALRMVGVSYLPEMLLGELLKDRKYYAGSGGGVTFSGGEPMLQVDYLEQMLRLCRRAGIHTAVDTAGCVPFAHFERVLPWTDLFLYDLKHWHSDSHRRCTGVPNELILENLRRLTDAGAEIFVRIPVIPAYNDDLETISRIARYLARLPQREKILLIQLLPYHNYGVGKYAALGETAPTAEITPPSDECMKAALDCCLAAGLPARIK